MKTESVDFQLVAQQVGRLSWRFFRWIFLIEIVFALVYVMQTPSVTINRLFDLDAESTLPMWFSSMQLLLLSLTTSLAWKLRDAQTWKRAGWFCVAGLFAYLSADEAAKIHESFGAAATKQFGITLWGDYFWLLVFAPLVLIGILALLAVIWCELRADKTAFYLALAGLMLWIGSLGLETLEKWISGRQIAVWYGFPRVVIVVEELCEMVGATFFWMAMTRWIFRQTSDYHTSDSKQFAAAK